MSELEELLETYSIDRHYLSEELKAAQQQVKTFTEALPPAYRLRALADMFYIAFPDDPYPEIQKDLQTWAASIDTALD